MIEDKDFIGKIWHQNCGDDLLVIEKSDVKIRGVYAYKCEFQKYKFEVFVLKDNIIKGKVLNPQIEQVEFIDKIWKQNCGDSLKIIRKSDKREVWECEFIKYPYQILAKKTNILRGKVINPQIEVEEFVKKIWPQNCGDSLKIIKKSNIKKGESYLFEATFIKYPYKILVLKDGAIKGTIVNPQIEQVEFIDKIWPQSCGDSLKIIQKSKKQRNHQFLWECQFIKYPCIITELKSHILNKCVDNPNLPHKKKELLISYIKENFKEKPTIQELADSLNISRQELGQRINKYNINFLISYSFIESENNVRERINEVIETTKYNDKKYEIDIYISSCNLGIEYNGNYWHSNLYRENNYHQKKSLYFKEKGIDLIHIFEWEWEQKQDILINLIKRKVTNNFNKIFARKCIIKELDYRTYADFCNENHLQGEAGAKIKLGLFYKDKLVQIMSFGSPRFTDKYEWEIIRECSKLNYKVIGGKEKLWKYFIKKYNPKNCISYCDFSKFTGDSYLKLGFKYNGLNKPGFVWYDKKKNITYWRDPFHHKEMKEKGFLQIYDCGQLVFVWNC